MIINLPRLPCGSRLFFTKKKFLFLFLLLNHSSTNIVTGDKNIQEQGSGSKNVKHRDILLANAHEELSSLKDHSSHKNLRPSRKLSDCENSPCNPEDYTPSPRPPKKPSTPTPPTPTPPTPTPPTPEDNGDDGQTSEESSDPHFKTWKGDKYDFHGECDMVHVTNDHLDLHIRTQAIWNGHPNHWSGVVLAALRFDNDILEVNALEENAVSVNGNPITSNSVTLDEMYPVEVSTKRTGNKSVKVTMSGGQFIEYIFHLDSLIIRMDAHGSDFYESQGMAGNWDEPGLIGRDGVKTFDLRTGQGRNLYATEWEVNADRGDPILFSTPPIHKCSDIPQAPPMEEKNEQRRLVDLEVAKELCDRIAPEGNEWREDCIFDMLRSNFDEEVLENPTYKDPFHGTERCVAAPKEEIAANADANGVSCAELGGECVYRCNTAKHDCRPDALCVEATDLTVVDVARRRLKKVEFIEGCSCAVPKMKSSSVVDHLDECMDDPEFEFAVGEGVRGSSMKMCDWLHEMEGRTDKYCETKGYDPDATTMIKSACRGACVDYLSECM